MKPSMKKFVHMSLYFSSQWYGLCMTSALVWDVYEALKKFAHMSLYFSSQWHGMCMKHSLKKFAHMSLYFSSQWHGMCMKHSLKKFAHMSLHLCTPSFFPYLEQLFLSLSVLMRCALFSVVVATSSTSIILQVCTKRNGLPYQPGNNVYQRCPTKFDQGPKL